MRTPKRILGSVVVLGTVLGIYFLESEPELKLTSTPQKSAHIHNTESKLGPQNPQRSPAQAGGDIESVEKKLDDTFQCYVSENCNFPKTDPKSYYFAVGQQLKNDILQFQAQVIKHRIVSPRIQNMALFYLKAEDGHVKAAALHLLSTQPVAEKSVDAIINEILNYHDSMLINHALLELLRYLGSSSEDKIHQALNKAIRTGAPFVSREITNHIEPFINQNSLRYYQETLSTLSQSTLIYKTLKTRIEEFSRKQTAA